MNRRGFIKIASGIAFFFSSSLSLAYACIRRFYPEGSTGQEGATGVNLRDIKIDKYGRTLVKGRSDKNDNAHLAADSTNLICPCPDPPKPPSVPDLVCKCPDPPPPPPVPDLVCSCPQPPPPPPVPDLVCSCPTPPKPPGT